MAILQNTFSILSKTAVAGVLVLGIFSGDAAQSHTLKLVVRETAQSLHMDTAACTRAWKNQYIKPGLSSNCSGGTTIKSVRYANSWKDPGNAFWVRTNIYGCRNRGRGGCQDPNKYRGFVDNKFVISRR